MPSQRSWRLQKRHVAIGKADAHAGRESGRGARLGSDNASERVAKLGRGLQVSGLMVGGVYTEGCRCLG